MDRFAWTRAGFGFPAIVLAVLAAGCTESSPKVGESTGGTGNAETSSTSATTTSATTVAQESSSGEATGPDSVDDSGSTSSGSETTGQALCEVDADCSNPYPLCIDNVCWGCDISRIPDAACEAADPERPICSADGSCVQCTSALTSECTGTTPVCENTTGSCVACTRHEQCPASACDIETGECFSSDCVVDVDEDGGKNYEDLESALFDTDAYDSCAKVWS